MKIIAIAILDRETEPAARAEQSDFMSAGNVLLAGSASCAASSTEKGRAAFGRISAARTLCRVYSVNPCN